MPPLRLGTLLWTPVGDAPYDFDMFGIDDLRCARVESRPFLALLLAIGLVPPAVVADDAPDVGPPEKSALEREAEEAFPDAAPLNQSAGAYRSLEQIAELADSGRAIEALRAWQARLDGIAGIGPFAGGVGLRSLALEPEGLQRSYLQGGAYARYGSLRSVIQSDLLDRAEAERDLYEREIGPQARVLWQKYEETGDPAGLEAIVDRYFATKLAVRAALQLATVRLDQGDAGEAVALLEDLRRRHPDADRHLVAIDVRRVIAHARLGETKNALAVWTGLAATSPPALTRQVERELARGRVPTLSESEGWTSFRGDAAGLRIASPIDPNRLGDELTDRWSLPLDVRPVDVAPPGLEVGLPQETGPVGTPMVQSTLRSWRTHGRSPTAVPLVAGDGVLVRGHHRLLHVDATTGQVLWMARRNEHDVENGLRQFVSRRAQFGLFEKQPDNEEVRDFFDRVPTMITRTNDRVFVLEGRSLEVDRSVEPAKQNRNVTRRLRENRLACYDLRSGRQLWDRPAHDAGARFDDVGFLAAPTPVGKAVVAPVTEGGEVWILAMSPADGRTLWRTYLCDEPPGGCSPVSPARIVGAGTRLYVLPGTGAVFCLDADDGSPAWAVRYDRSTILTLANRDRMAMRYALFDFLGWEEDALVVSGRHLLLFPSDTTRLVCLDRHDGSFLWDAAMQPPSAAKATEFLGTHDDGVLVSGPNVVRRYAIADGRLLWETPLDGSTGRGLVTPEAVLVPVDERLVILDPRTGKVDREVAYVSPSRTPLGNLSTTGAGLVSVGATRISLLSPLPAELDLLAGRIRNGDPLARLQRARLLHRTDRFDAAFDDVSTAATEAARNGNAAAAREVLVVAARFDLATARPRETLDLLVDANGLARFLGDDEERLFRDRWNEIAYDCLATIGRDRLTGAVPQILDAVVLARDAHQIAAATASLTTTTAPDDLPVLRAALEDRSDPERRRAAIRAFESERLEDTVIADLEPLLSDDDLQTRLVAATALVNRGERSGVAGLVDLLSDDDANVSRQALDRLRASTAQRLQGSVAKEPEARRALEKSWRDWLAATSDDALDLRLPVARATLLRGRTLVANAQTGNVVEYDRAGRERWRVRVPSARDAYGTEDGRRLVVSYSNRSLAEFDAGDTEESNDERPEPLREQKNLPGRPYSIQELPGGNVLVALWDKGAVQEYNREGQMVWQAELKGIVADARRLENGNTLVTWYSQNAVVEVDREGKIVPGSRIDNMNGPRSAQRLANGNTLVSQYRTGRVVEVDPKGRIVWSHDGVSGVQCAQRLPNGNTIVVHRTAVVELRRDGSLVWELPGTGVARVHRY